MYFLGFRRRVQVKRRRPKDCMHHNPDTNISFIELVGFVYKDRRRKCAVCEQEWPINGS